MLRRLGVHLSTVALKSMHATSCSLRALQHPLLLSEEHVKPPVFTGVGQFEAIKLT